MNKRGPSRTNGNLVDVFKSPGFKVLTLIKKIQDSEKVPGVKTLFSKNSFSSNLRNGMQFRTVSFVSVSEL